MPPHMPRFAVRAPGAAFPLALLTAAALSLAGCKEQVSNPQTASGSAPAAAAASAAASTAPAMSAAAPAPMPVAVPAAAVAAGAAASVAAAPRKLPLGVQGVAPAGVTVRVKGVELGGDATVLDVSISFANRITDSTMLALADTFLEDEGGARLHIKRPADNRDITIREGDTLDGQLVFLGSVAPTARKLRLVFNDGNEGDNIVAPGLVMELPLS